VSYDRNGPTENNNININDLLSRKRLDVEAKIYISRNLEKKSDLG
jgi:hypothetical protein